MRRFLLLLCLPLLAVLAPVCAMAFNPFEAARIDQKPDAGLPLDNESSPRTAQDKA